MGKIAFIFPGQGAQFTGMGKDFFEKYESSKKYFKEATVALNRDVEELIFDEKHSEDLKITKNTQPAILTATMAMLAPVIEAGITPDYVAGLSLGEYAAHVLSGTMTFSEAVVLVEKRGKFMQEAVPIGQGTMAAIVGLDRESVLQAAKESSSYGVCEAANFNCPGQIVLSGEVKAIEKACEICKEKGAKRAIILPVSAPFHSSMLVKAKENLEKELKKIELQDMKYPVVTNVTAKVVNKKDVKDILAMQVTSSVYWQDSIEMMIEDGVDTFIEIGPGKTLTSFMRKIDKKMTAINISSVDSFDKALSILQNS